MNPKVDDVIRQKQGSMDPESAWAIARTNWVTQLLVHFEKINDNQIADEAFLKDLPKLSINQIAFWDEMPRSKLLGTWGRNLTDSTVIQMENMTHMEK